MYTQSRGYRLDCTFYKLGVDIVPTIVLYLEFLFNYFETKNQPSKCRIPGS